MPDSRFKLVWNIVMIFLLVYVATYVPYKIAFVDNTTTGGLVFDIIIDCLFLSDIIITFFSAYEDIKNE